jgi:RNA polymerase sigma-70 factor, ECF subfamily
MSARDSRQSPDQRSVPAPTSTSLLGRAKAREGEAWRRIVELYGPQVYDWCRHCGLKAEDAADVAQEVFAAVAKNIEAFHRDRPGDTFRGWLWTIARNKIRDHFRGHKENPEGPGGTTAQQRLAQIPEQPPEASTSGASAASSNSLQQRAIELVRAGVEERTWEAFWQVVVEGKDAAGVARELGMSVQAVYDAKYRIRRRIRQQFDGLLE